MTIIIRSALALALTASLVACGAQGYGTSPGDSFALARISPGNGETILTNAQHIAPLPATVGYTGSVLVPRALNGAGTSLAIYTGVYPKDGTTTPVLAPTQVGSARAPIPLIYLQFTPTADTTLASYPGFTIDLPDNIPTGPQFYIGAYDPATPLAGYALATEGPATVTGSTLTFTPPPTITPVLRGKSVYAYVLYEIPTPAPSPIPAK